MDRKELAEIVEKSSRFYSGRTPSKGVGRLMINISDEYILNRISKTLKEYKISHYKTHNRIEIRYKKNINSLYNVIKNYVNEEEMNTRLVSINKDDN